MGWPLPRTSLERPRVSETLLRAAHRAMYFSGAGALFVRARVPEGAMILMYHGVVRSEDAPWVDPRFSVSVSAFDAQMRFLRRHRRVISMTELVDRIERGGAIRPGTVVITFDDGYKSTADVAAPILKSYDLPAVVYLATSYVSREKTQFIDALFSAFRARTRHALRLSHEGSREFSGDLRRAKVARRVYLALGHRLMVSSYEEREGLLSEVVDQLRPEHRGPRLTMSWDDVRRLRKIHPRFEIGVHTRHHIDLTSCHPTAASDEIAESVEDVRRELGIAAQHFSFPFGRSNGWARAAAAQAKLRSAAVTEPAALARSGTDVFGLPRLSAPPSMSLFPFQTSGAYPDLSHRLLGRA